MKKEVVNLYLTDDGLSKKLSIKTKDNQEYIVDIFSGGGYVNQIWLRTEKEIEELRMKSIEIDQKWRDEMADKIWKKRNKKWWHFWS